MVQHASGLKKRARERVEAWKRQLDEALRKAESEIDQKFEVLEIDVK